MDVLGAGGSVVTLGGVSALDREDPSSSEHPGAKASQTLTAQGASHMLSFSSFLSYALRLTQKKDQLTGSLQRAALNNRLVLAIALVDAGADFRAGDSCAIRIAANLGYFDLFSMLLGHYDPACDREFLHDLRLKVSHLSERQTFVDSLSAVISSANVLTFASKSKKYPSPIAA